MSKRDQLSLFEYDWSLSLLHNLNNLVLRFTSSELKLFETRLDNSAQHRCSIVKAHDHSIAVKIRFTILENAVNSQIFVLYLLQLRQVVL